MGLTDEVSRSLEYHCTADGVCHCDWRLSVVDCAESSAMKGIYIANMAVSGLAAVVGIALLIHRVCIKGHRFFDISSGRGFLRPKPIDCMLLFLLIFNILRILTSAVLVSNVVHNMTSRMFIFELPWQFGYGGFALYLIGIAQTLADSHKSISSSWLPSPRAVDIIGCAFFFSPFVTNNTVALAGGALARTNVQVAEICIRLLYIFWFMHCSILSIAVLFSGTRLIRILNRHLDKLQSSGPRYVSIKTGILKIQSVMGIIVICLLSFAVFLLLYGILRDQIMTSTVGSIFLGAVWNLLGPVTTLCVEVAVVFNPNHNNNAIGGFKMSSSGNANGNGNRGYNTTTTATTTTTTTTTLDGVSKSMAMTSTNPDSSYIGNTAMDTSFPGTMSHPAWEDLKQQQMQYQQVFSMYNQGHHGTNGPRPQNSSIADLNTRANDDRMTGFNLSMGRDDNTMPMNDLSFYGNYSPRDNHQQHNNNNEKPVWPLQIDDPVHEDFRDDLSSEHKLIQTDRRY